MWLVRLKQAGTWLGIVLTLIISVFLLISLQLPGESIPFQGAVLTYEPGAKAALFALASGALFVVSWLPDEGVVLGVFARWLKRLALAGTFFLTGWYWLLSVVGQGAWEHLSFPLLATLVFSVAIIVISAVLVFVSMPVVLLVVDAIRRFRDRR